MIIFSVIDVGKEKQNHLVLKEALESRTNMLLTDHQGRACL